MIHLCFPTLNRYDLLRKAILSAEAGSLKPDHYWIIDNGGSLELDLPNHIAITIHRPGFNMGVAGSFNWFLENLQDYIIISNDDLEVGYNTISQFYEAAESHPDRLFFCVAGDYLNAWSFFLERKISQEIIGKYDETFWPAYFEDNDRHYRYRLAGYDVFRIPDVHINHVGSATLAAFTGEQTARHHDHFRRNEEYYQLKWGGHPHNEVYTSEFGI